MRRHWVHSPHSGGIKMTAARKAAVSERIHAYAGRKLCDKCDQVIVRFRGALCYVDADQTQPDGRVFRFPLCRLRHFDLDRWSIALYTFSNERYEPCIFPSGEWIASLDEALDIGTTFLP